MRKFHLRKLLAVVVFLVGILILSVFVGKNGATPVNAGSCCPCGGNFTCSFDQGVCADGVNGQCLIEGGTSNCEVYRDCPAGTVPDWSTTTLGCGHWGTVCGDAVKRGGGKDCGYLCCSQSCYHVHRKNTVCEWECQVPCKQSSVIYATCRPACSATAPSNVSVTALSYSSARVTWTPGSGGTSQRIYVGSDKAKVEGNCPSGVGTGTGCVIANTSLTATQSSYETGSVLVLGTVYYYRVVNYSSATCSSASPTTTKLSSCPMNVSSLTLLPAQSALVTSSLASSADISRVTFTASGGEITVNPGSDSSYQYQTTVTGVTPTNPFATLTSNVYLTSAPATIACSSSIPVSITPPDPWWQVVDSDIYSRGELTDVIPLGGYLGLVGSGGYPGVAAYTTTTNVTGAKASIEQWLAQSPTSSNKKYNYTFFRNQIPDDTVINEIPSSSVDASFFESGGTPSYGYYWYRFDGNTSGLDLTITGDMNVNSSDAGRKVIILVTGANLYLTGNTALTDGTGFLIMIAGKNEDGGKGEISISPTVTSLEGLFAADGVISTGAGNVQLNVRGSVASQTNVFMERDLAPDNSLPAEKFTYAPDLIMNYPKKLSYYPINWKEVAP